MQGRHVTQEELEKIMKYNFEKWGKAYEMLAAGQEPVKEDPVPDESVTVEEMQDYGYTWTGMLPLTQERARELQEELPIHKLYNDGTEALIESTDELEDHIGLFGVEEDDWNRYIGKEVDKDGTELDY